jgi:hypothetical protein
MQGQMNTKKTAVKIDSVLTEIQAPDLQNTKQECRPLDTDILGTADSAEHLCQVHTLWCDCQTIQ